jgi:hypothetical protein
VPDEYGSTTTSVAGSMTTGGGSSSTAMEASDATPGASSIVTISIERDTVATAAQALSIRVAVVMSSRAFES